MGLFDFFKKGKKTEKQENESKLALAMPMFNEGDSYDIKKVITHLQDFWQLEVTEADDADNEAAVFYLNGNMVAISQILAPIPTEELEGVAPYNYFWKNALDDLKDHTTHAIVTVMSKESTTVENYILLSKILSSILMTSNCLGIYQGQQTLLLSKDYYLASVDDLKNNAVPVPVWVYIGIVRGEKGNSLYTYGMTEFGYNELEILDSKEDMDKLYDFMLYVSSYLLGTGAELKDGDTIGYDENQKVKISLSKAQFVEGKSFKFTI